MPILDSLRRDRARKKVKALIECTGKLDLLQAIWVIDRARNDSQFQIPSGYEYPVELLGSEIAGEFAIYSWELETLLTEILYWPERSGNRIGNPRGWGFVSKLVNSLRRLENFEYAASPTDIMQEVHRVLYRQIIWQMESNKGAAFVRWWSIMSEPRLAGIFQDNIGTTVEKFTMIGMLWNVLFNRRWKTYKPTAEQIPTITDTDIDAFLSATSRDLASAQEEARVTRSSSSATAYRKGILRRAPILASAENGRPTYIRPIETLLKWRVSSGLYYDVIGNVSARNIIGAQFETYIGDLLGAKFTHFTVMGEFIYGPRSRQKKSPDKLIIKDNQIRFIIECKTAKIPYAVQTSPVKTPEHERVAQDVAKGVAQVCGFEEDIRRGIDGITYQVAPDAVLMVVTLDDWLFFGREFRDEIFTRAEAISNANGYPTTRIAQRRVVLCSAAELETIVTRYETDAVLGMNGVFADATRDSMTLSAFRELGLPQLAAPQYPLENRVDEFFARFTERPPATP